MILGHLAPGPVTLEVTDGGDAAGAVVYLQWRTERHGLGTYHLLHPLT